MYVVQSMLITFEPVCQPSLASAGTPATPQCIFPCANVARFQSHQPLSSDRTRAGKREGSAAMFSLYVIHALLTGVAYLVCISL